VCPKHEHLKGEECVCDNGEYFLKHFEAFLTYFLDIPGFVRVHGKCVCPIHEILVNGACECEEGFERVNGECVCPIHMQLQDGKCVCELGNINHNSIF
jgi:hypothetical protein